MNIHSEMLIKSDPPKIAAARMYRLPPYLFGRINSLKMTLRRKGIDIIDLGMGNPNDPTPRPIVEKLKEAAGLKQNQRYSASQGIFNLRRDLAQFYERKWQVNLKPETEVIATIGSKEGFSHLCLACLGPGDTVLTPTPTFPIHIYSPIIAGANVVGVSMEGGEDSLLARIVNMCKSISPRPKIVILNYPHNPTAATVELGFYKEVVKLAKKFGFYIINDFAYGLTVFDGYKAPSMLQVPGAKEIGVELMTMSKGYNMAGWRIGFAVGNPDMIKLLSDIKGYYDYGIFQAIQIAAVIALRQCDEDMEKQALIYARRRDILCDGLQKAGWEIVKPKATMFIWVKIPEKFQPMGSIEFSLQSLQKAEVAMAPGVGFGEDGEGYLRIALVENEERLKQAIRQIKRTFPTD